jgi:hypothetical protein
VISFSQECDDMQGAMHRGLKTLKRPGHNAGEATAAVGDERHPTCAFSKIVVLSKSEVFDLCAGLAELQPLLHDDGHAAQAIWVEALFERFEDRLSIC